jgi:predicted site-specific integrase-resolvase
MDIQTDRFISGRTEVMKQRFTITEVADMLGVSPKTLARWEKVGKIRRSKRDWRGWRVYEDVDVQQIKDFHEAVFEA